MLTETPRPIGRRLVADALLAAAAAVAQVQKGHAEEAEATSTPTPTNVRTALDYAGWLLATKPVGQCVDCVTYLLEAFGSQADHVEFRASPEGAWRKHHRALTGVSVREGALL